MAKTSRPTEIVLWGLSSAGRASALQAEGHRFEPYRPHNLQIFGTFCSSYGGIAQLARAHGSYPWCRWFKSSFRYCQKSPYLVRVFLHLKKIVRRPALTFRGWNQMIKNCLKSILKDTEEKTNEK